MSHKTPYDSNEAKASFERIAKSVATKCRKLAAGALESAERQKVGSGLRASIDTLHHLSRFTDPDYVGGITETYYARADGLWAAVRFAGHANAANYREACYAESARLQRAEREARANEDGYTRELRLTAALQGRRYA